MKKKIVMIIIGLIILIPMSIYIYSTSKKQPCNCLLDGAGNEGVNEEMGTFKNINVDEAKAALDSDSSIILLDVRTVAEYNERHIPNSVLIPLDELKNRAISELPNKDAKIIVYCRSGARSASASNILVNLGYTNVYNMLGGITSWK